MVPSIQLFDLASKQARWLEIRQSIVASNVANANTPGYKTRRVKDFSALLQDLPFEMATTNPRHITDAEENFNSSPLLLSSWEELNHSRNDVNIEDEMRKGGEIAREMELNTAIVKAFHRMLLSVTKGI